MAESKFMVFAGTSSVAFAESMCAYMGVPLSKSSCIRFSDGNIMVRADESVRAADVYLVLSMGMNPNEEFVELLFWCDAFKRSGARSVTVILPYFAYAKADKRDEPRVSIRARVCAESIELAGADRVITMDLHSGQVQGFFKKPVDHLYGMLLLCDAVKTNMKKNPEPWIVVSPDAGFVGQARRIARHLDLPVAIGDKRRVDHTENAEVLDIIGDVEGKNALIVDDFTISCGTLIHIADALIARGARRILAMISHNVLTEEGARKLEESQIDLLFASDTLDNGRSKNCKKLRVVSVAPLFAEVILRIHNHEAISPLTERLPAKVFEHSGGRSAL